MYVVCGMHHYFGLSGSGGVGKLRRGVVGEDVGGRGGCLGDGLTPCHLCVPCMVNKACAGSFMISFSYVAGFMFVI